MRKVIRGETWDIQPKDTLQQAKKIQAWTKQKQYENRDVIARQATEEQVSNFIDKFSEPVARPAGRTAKSRTYWVRCTWNLSSGKPIMFNDKFINPAKLDISKVQTKSLCKVTK